MRISAVAAAVLTLVLLGSGKLNAQTADVQRTADTKLAIARLERGMRIASSIQVLAEAALDEATRNLQRTGVLLHRLFDRLSARPGGSMRREMKP